MRRSKLTAYNFPKSERILKRREFLGISSTGKKYHTTHFVVFFRQTDSGQARLGITVSRKVGNAVVRNRIKRLIREYYRNNKILFVNSEFSIIAKHGAGLLDLLNLGQELQRAITVLKTSR